MRSRFSGLPTELLMEIFGNLNPDESASVVIAYPKLGDLISDIWQRRVKRHFPDSIPDYMADYIDDWSVQFAELENQNYEQLPDKLRRLFYLVKECKFKSIIDTPLTIDELLMTDNKGDSLLSLAITSGYQMLLDCFFIIALRYFVTDDALDPELTDSEGNSVLHWAVLCNQSKDIISALTDSECDMNARSGSGSTPLAIAIHHGYYTLAECLLAHGADPDLQDNSGHSPLQLAVYRNVEEPIHLLIKHGADFKIPISHKKNFSKPIHVAAATGHMDAVRALALYDDINEGDHGTGKTPLHAAAEHGQTKIMRYLLSYGADINARDQNGYTPMHGALINNQDAAACFLIEHDCEINTLSLNNNTPLSSAVLHNMHAAAELLLQSHARPTPAESNHLDMSLLYLAAMNNSLELMKLLINRGADINQKSIDGRTALFVAVILGHYKAARLLLKHCANPNLPNEHGLTPLYVAARKGDLAMTKLLLRYHANTEFKCPHDQLTPSLKAAACGYVEVSNVISAHAQATKKYLGKNSNRLFARNHSAENHAPDGNRASIIARKR